MDEVIKVCCTPIFFASATHFEPVMKELWAAHDKLVKSRVISPDGRLSRGCKGCNGRKLMRVYSGVYRTFVRRCLELSNSNPQALEPIRSLFGVKDIVLVDPETCRPVSL